MRERYPVLFDFLLGMPNFLQYLNQGLTMYFTGSDTHGHEFDKSKGNALCVSGSEACRCNWAPVFYFHGLCRITESKSLRDA